MSRDNYPHVDGEQVEAVVKWFNLTKGFGFVAPMDHSPDAFMHVSVLTRAGLQQIAEGTRLLVTVGPGPKGRQVVQILQVLGMSDSASSQGGFSSGGMSGGMNARPSRAPASGPTENLTGTVKWFKADKGFGFVTPDDGGKDVFVHRTVVMNAGLQLLEPMQRLQMVVQTASKGREAVSIEAI